jgi:hypothetical protein
MMIASSVPLYFQACLSLSLEWLCVFVVWDCCKPPSYVPYKGTYVPYDGTFGVPDQGQTLDV